MNTYVDEEWMEYLAEFCYNNAIYASTLQSPFLSLYNYQVNNSPHTADLVHSLGEMKVIDSFAHNLGNLKQMIDIVQTRYLDKMDEKRTDNYPNYRLLDLVRLRKPENYDALPFYKLSTRKFSSFKIVGVDEEKKNYRLDLSRSLFPNMYPVFHISELEPFFITPKELVPPPSEEEKIIHILGSRKYRGNYQYLVSYKNYQQKWVDASVIDENPHYSELLKEYQDFNYNQFLANVNQQ